MTAGNLSMTTHSPGENADSCELKCLIVLDKGSVGLKVLAGGKDSKVKQVSACSKEISLSWPKF